ncbi:MAG: DUF881 domain-containing protein [Frankiaceae bacterium]|nr:DUF881 domain-containing protein [Frankiaceae bacterium]
MSSGPAGTTPTAPAPRRVDASMSLLVDMMTNTLDESYAEAARRRAGDGGPLVDEPGFGPLPSAAGRRATAVVLLVALGVVTGTAAAQVRQRDAAAGTVRAQLVREVASRTADSDALAEQTATLRRAVGAQQDAALTSSSAGVAVAAQLAALELATGVEPVTGPGLVVRLDDAPSTEEEVADRGGQAGSGRVLDRDLQDAVNGLWSAGAEAIAINGLRLSALTAIRSAGEAILVDYRPLSPPYTLRALGDPGRLEAGFADSAAGRRLSTYTSLYGLELVVERSEEQTLPGATAPSLRLATAAEGPS